MLVNPILALPLGKVVPHRVIDSGKQHGDVLYRVGEEILERCGHLHRERLAPLLRDPQSMMGQAFAGAELG
jgi:hypothetical protein